MPNGYLNGQPWTFEPITVPDTPPRILTDAQFLALWTVDEYAAAMADKELAYAQAGVITQRQVNMDSTKMPGLLARAVQIGAITQERAAQIAAGTPPS